MRTPAALQPLIDDGVIDKVIRSLKSGKYAPELLQTEFAREMWALFERGELTADSTLSGIFVRDDTPLDAEAVLVAVEDAREEALRRELGARKLRHR